ncbi:MAG: hypothetical protein ACK4ND_04370 [Cytophagaceae bacterium]
MRDFLDLLDKWAAKMAKAVSPTKEEKNKSTMLPENVEIEEEGDRMFEDESYNEEENKECKRKVVHSKSYLLDKTSPLNRSPYKRSHIYRRTLSKRRNGG